MAFMIVVVMVSLMIVAAAGTSLAVIVLMIMIFMAVVMVMVFMIMMVMMVVILMVMTAATFALMAVFMRMSSLFILVEAAHIQLCMMHGIQDLLSIQLIPGRSNHRSLRVMLPQKSCSLLKLLLRHALGTA